MASFDSVEKLRERSNVSYEDARAALNACGDDLLEAIIYLEKQGKVSPPAGGGSYTSRHEPAPANTDRRSRSAENSGESFSDIMRRFWRWCGKVLHSGNSNQFEVWHKNEKIISVPVTVLVLLLLFAFWITAPLLVAGLFCSCRYAFSGSASRPLNVNDVMDSAANAAEGLKHEIKQANQKYKDHESSEK